MLKVDLIDFFNLIELFGNVLCLILKLILKYIFSYIKIDYRLGYLKVVLFVE